MAEQTARDAKVVQFLSEAYQKEAELEADLTAHISLTQKKSYRQRLEQHLKETRDHKRRVESRIKKLGGEAATGVQVPGVPSAAGELVGKGVAAVKGQVGVARALVTEQAETHLRNAREEYREEHVEIGLYRAILALAQQVGDRDTTQLAKSILRDEERMAKYLERQIPTLMGEVVTAEIPRDQRATGRKRRTSRKRPSSRKKTSSSKSGSSKKSSGSKKKSSARRSSGSKKSSAKKSSARKSSGSKKSTSRKSAAKKR